MDFGFALHSLRLTNRHEVTRLERRRAANNFQYQCWKRESNSERETQVCVCRFGDMIGFISYTDCVDVWGAQLSVNTLEKTAAIWEEAGFAFFSEIQTRNPSSIGVDDHTDGLASLESQESI